MHYQRWAIPGIVCACAILASWLAAPRTLQTGPPARAALPAEPDVFGSEHPFQVGPLVSLRGQLDKELIRKGVARLTLQRVSATGEVLHALRLFGPDAAVFDQGLKRPVQLLDRLLDHDLGVAAFGGEPPLIDTREGVRCRISVPRDRSWQRERQTHEDQLLAVLAEIGVPLGRPLTTAGGQRSVRDILKDTCANYNPDQPEIEWSGLAIGLYLPPQTSWRDKYGKEYSLDFLAESLMGRRFHETLPCAGTHLLYTLTVLLRVDEGSSVLSAPVREKLHRYLRERTALAARTQAEDGTWAPSWYLGERALPVPPEAPPEAAWPRVLATGHHVEWLMLLPPDLQPPPGCFLRAARWLQVRLATDPTDALFSWYCPYSHAGKVLVNLTAPPEPGDTRPRPGAAPVPAKAGS